MCKVLLIFLVSLAAPALWAQRATGAIKIAEFDQRVERKEVFIQRANEFIKRLSFEDQTTRASINVYEDDRLGMELIKLLYNKPELRKRFDLLIPGRKYIDEPANVEFWLVPKDADWPFVPVCMFCECPDIKISGLESISNKQETATFTADVSGGSQDSVTYKWTVAGAEIKAGQATASINVSVPVNGMGEIIATLEIGGIDPSCSCLTFSTYKTRVLPK
jgi:hypothetical protein